MALCEMCGGYSRNIRVPVMPIVPPIETDPYCSQCGERKYSTCTSCNGSGYIMVPSPLVEYCSRCGQPINNEEEQQCSACHGTGQAYHICRRF